MFPGTSIWNWTNKIWWYRC